METPKWKPNMTDIEYLSYVMACNYLGIEPKPRF